MSRRRTACSLVGLSSLALATALVPVTFAHAVPVAPGATLTVAPTHGTPGTALTGTVTLTGCDAAAVSVAGAYVDVNGDDATTPAVDGVVTSDANVFTAALAVPADAARSDLAEQPLTFTATATCSTASASPSPSATATAAPAAYRSSAVRAAATGPTATATADVVVDALAEPTVTVTPAQVTLGKAFSFTISGCTGGLADLYVLDGADKDTTVPDANVVQDSATAYHGTYTFPTSATAGSGALVVDCAQAASSGADVQLLATGPSAGSGAAAPVAVPVTRTPRFTG